MSYQTNNSYGYQRPNPMGYGHHAQGGMPMMGSAGVYGGAPVVSFPAPPAAPVAPQAKPYYRCWDNTQKKWFYWEKDSSVTTWTEPAPHITLIDHETGSIVQRDQPPIVSRPPPPVVDHSQATAVSASSNVMGAAAAFGASRQFASSAAPVVSQPISVQPAASTVTAAPVRSVQPAVSHPAVSATPQRVAASQPTINPNYSAGVSRYTTAGASGSASASHGVSAAERARIEEADRAIAEQLQKQLSMEAEAELVASCPLPGEAAKLFAGSKKKAAIKAPAPAKKAEEDDKIIADMASSGFVIKKQKQKKPATGGNDANTNKK